MYKQYDLSGIWRFAMDPDKTGVRDGLFETLLPDTIPLPAPPPRPERVHIIGNGEPAF